MQLGFRAALFESAVRWHERLNYDIALFSTNSVFIVRPQPFSNRRLYQALGDTSVASVSPVHIFPGVWKNPWNNDRRSINVIGFNPEDEILDAKGFDEYRQLLRRQDVVIFDAASRPEFGPMAEEFNPDDGLGTELNDRQIRVVGLFEMGLTFIFFLKALSLSDSSSKVGNLIYLSPFLSMFLIRFVLDERIYPATIVGLTLIIIGILYQASGGRSSTESEST